MSKVLYYLVLIPLSKLPLGVLYGISDFLYLLLYKILSYRQKVVRTNLVKSFPNKSKKEIEVIEKDFYRHFCDLLVESVRMFSISASEIKARSFLTNPELFNQLYDEGRSIVLVGGHYNNWEIGAAILPAQVKHHIIGIYAPLTNPFFNAKILESRSKFGMEMLAKKEVKAGFEKYKNQASAFIFATDQSPTHSKQVHWSTFLHQPTAIHLGAESFARQYGYAVVFMYVTKVKRGYYTMEAKLLEADPANTREGEITEKHKLWLEKQIEAEPRYWLWTHKRWKRKFKEGDQMYTGVPTQ